MGQREVFGFGRTRRGANWVGQRENGGGCERAMQKAAATESAVHGFPVREGEYISCQRDVEAGGAGSG